MFGVLGVIVVRVIHPMVQMFLQQIPFAAQTITAIVLTGLFLWDNIHTFMLSYVKMKTIACWKIVCVN